MTQTTGRRADPLAAALARLLEGDDGAMAEIVRETRPRLLAVARRIGDPQDAEDAVQAAYLSLVRHRGSALDVPVFPWLLTATLRIAYRTKAIRRREERLASLLAREAAWDEGPLADAMSAEDAAVLRAEVDRLPRPHRDVVVLHYLQGLSTAETALLLETSDAAVRKRLERARDLLRGGRLRRLALFAAASIASAGGLRSARVASAGRTAFLGGAMKTSTAVVGFVIATALGASVAAFASRGAAASSEAAAAELRRDVASLRAQLAERDAKLRAAEERASRAARVRAEAPAPAESVTARESEKPAAPPAVPAAAAEPTLRITGAPYDDVLRRVDWTTLGKHVREVMTAVREASNALEKGVPPDRNIDVRLKQHEAAVEAELVKVLNDVPGADGPRIFTHPGFLGNAVAAALDAAGMPFSEAQLDALSGLSRRFAEDDAARSSGYDERTFALRKLIDEADLRQRFCTAALDVMTPEQRDLAAPPAMRDRMDGDLVSAAILWKNRAEALTYADERQFVSAVTDALGRRLDVADADRAALRAVVERWAATLPRGWFDGTSGVVETHGRPRISVTAELARRQLELLESLSSSLALTPAQADAVRAMGTTWRLEPAKKR